MADLDFALPQQELVTVYIDGRRETRPLSHIERGSFGMIVEVPVLRANEIMTRTIDGKIYIVKTGE